MHWVVGDVQGCARELEDLLEAIAFDEHRDTLVLAGDLVNRGPDSRAVVELWRALGGRGVLGNHEVYALCAHSGRWPRKHDTLQGLYDAPDAATLLQALRDLPVLLHLPAPDDGGPEAWVVHGGIDPRWTDLQQVAATINAGPHDDAWLLSDPVNFATRVRCCTADGERNRHDGGPEGCEDPFRPWDVFVETPALIVHGHWARRGHYRGSNTLGLDSGCVYGGHLTAWCQEEDRIVQVPARSG